MTVVDGRCQISAMKGVHPATPGLVVSRGGGYIGPACKISPPKVARDRLQRTIFATVASGSTTHPRLFSRLLPSTLIILRHVLISPLCMPVSFFFFLFFTLSLERGSSFVEEMIAEAIIIEEFEYAFNAYPFIKVKQHLRKLDRFRIQASGSRIIVLLPGN